jgi:hypothetical protein
MATPSSTARSFSDHGSLLGKKLDSDDHFERPFSPYRMETKQSKRKEKTMKSLTHFKKRTRQTVALVISTCALALGAFTASAAPDSGRIPIRTGNNRTVAIGLVLPPGGHPATANRFSPTTAAQARRPTSLRDKWWCYF